MPNNGPNGVTEMRERDKVFAVLRVEKSSDTVQTELRLSDLNLSEYPIHSGCQNEDWVEHYETRYCHFETWESNANAGKILSVPNTFERRANATLTWTWDNPAYKGA